MWLWILGGFTALLLLLTLLPLSRLEIWWVRILDFPRLQLAIIALLLLACQLWVLYFSQWQAYLFSALTLACFVYQSYWLFPYTFLHPKEVKSAPGNENETLRILNANVLISNRNAQTLLNHIAKNKPDIFITLETDDWWQTQLDNLDADYPHSMKCPLDNAYGMHLYSRLPLDDAKIQFLVESGIPSMHTAVILPSNRKVALHCIHPRPPSPTENDESSERDAELLIIAKTVAEARLPTIVVGDLNDVSWSATTHLFRKLSGFLDPRIGRDMINTFHAKYPVLRWPLDHVFHSDYFTLVSINRLPTIGSDHFPLLVELALAPEKGASQEGSLDCDPEDRSHAKDKTSDENVSKHKVHMPCE
ncbi:MAG TPA: endonuclease/exonuclease/phosphatase family protein [Gammaproteobacteria bacterium]|nr:endonuclease/exonuclease/phosphatase family protein [Gammaproteobacteria bacterium]